VSLAPGVLFSALLLGSSPAYAIPSPEVVVSFFSNTAQIFGLLTLAVGGAFFSRQRMTRRRRGGPGNGPTVPGGRGLFAALVALLLVSAVANVLQWSRSADARIERLSANLVRASTEAGQRVGDVSLRTLALSDQVRHPQGITTGELDALMRAAAVGGSEPVNFIDVREDEEWETAQLDGFRHARYPDVLAQIDGLALPGHRNVLLCHSGNLELKVCAEGVENEAVLSMLQTFGCDYVQGFYFSAPVAADRVPDFIQAIDAIPDGSLENGSRDAVA